MTKIPIEVTDDDQRISDALVAVYLGGASESVSLFTISLLTEVPVSNLYGAIRRHWGTIPRGARPTKLCSKCKEEHLVADFSRNRTRKKDGLSHACKRCERIRQQIHLRKRRHLA